MKIRLATTQIQKDSIVDGEGIRAVIWTQGCIHNCPGCHNPQSWDFNGGYEMTVQQLLDIIKDDEFANVTFSGGDPFYQVEAFTELARRIKEETGKTIWCYTGYTYEEILADERLKQILPYIDTLVDGPFIAELRDPELHFRGSSNQRIIHLTEQNVEGIPGTVALKPFK
jgi:anaerobic ribonucleoside-triphosphate reductase activating protein